jgi:predicted Zn-dependent protease
VQLDSNFAMAYLALGTDYGNLGEWSEERENLERAYALRERVSTREAFYITAGYFDRVVGDIQKARETLEMWAQTYPQDGVPLDHLGNDYLSLGQYPQALEALLREQKLAHGGYFNYGNLAAAYLNLGRLRDVRLVVEQARAKQLEPLSGYTYLYFTDFLEGNPPGMKAAVAWATGKSGIEDSFLNMESDTAAYSGHLREARILTERAVEAALAAGEKDTAATYRANAALREAEFGNSGRAVEAAGAALALSQSTDIKTLVALASSRASSASRAENFTSELAKANPSNTILNVYWLPTIRAAIELDSNRPAQAVEALQRTAPYELGAPSQLQPGTLYPVYVRGQSFLRLNQPTKAADEFQKLLDHPGCVMNFPLGVLAHLGLARAYAMQGDAAKTKAWYQDFLTMWKDADPDIPIYKQAKAEYAKLQ